jgi:hypothetical protein
MYVWQPPNYSLMTNLPFATASDKITSMALLQSDWFAVGGDNFDIEVFDSSFIYQHTMGGPAVVVSLAALSDGNLASSYADGTIRIWNPTTNTLMNTYSIGDTSMKLIPRNTNLIYNSDSYNWFLLNTLNGNTQFITTSGHTAKINAFVYNGATSNIASVGDDQKCIVKNFNTFSQITKTESGPLYAVAYLNDGRVAMAGCPATIKIFSI